MAGLDSTDCRILQSLQIDASQSLADIAKQVNLSPNACWHRIKHLEQDGIILKRVALLDPAKLGIGVTVFVLVRAGEHSEEWFQKLCRPVRCDAGSRGVLSHQWGCGLPPETPTR